MAKKHPAIDTSAVPAPIVGTDANPVKVEVRREGYTSPDFVSLYANDIQVQITPWDVRLILGEISNVPTAADPTINIKELGEVRMSPQLAKQVTMLMLGQLKTYEEQFGEIPGPKVP